MREGESKGTVTREKGEERVPPNHLKSHQNILQTLFFFCEGKAFFPFIRKHSALDKQREKKVINMAQRILL